MLTAWGDESGSQPERDPGIYIVAAAVIEDDDVPLVRKTMDGLMLPSETKVHWHGSSDERRHALVDAVTGLPLRGVVVVRHEPEAKDRRHRRKCLEFLLPGLAYIGCERFTLESRGTQDASDLDLLQKFRATKVVKADMRIEHSRGLDESILSVADIMCGAVVQDRVGNSTYLRRFGDRLKIETI